MCERVGSGRPPEGREVDSLSAHNQLGVRLCYCSFKKLQDMCVFPHLFLYLSSKDNLRNLNDWREVYPCARLVSIQGPASPGFLFLWARWVTTHAVLAVVSFIVCLTLSIPFLNTKDRSLLCNLQKNFLFSPRTVRIT